MVFLKCHVCVLGGHMWSSLCIPCTFFQAIFTRHIDPMCVPFTLHEPFGSALEKQSEEKALNNAHPALRCCLCSSALISALDLPLTLPSPPKPTHTDPAHLIFSPLVMSNSCRVDSQGITAIPPRPPAPLPSPRSPGVWPPSVRSAESRAGCLDHPSRARPPSCWGL